MTCLRPTQLCGGEQTKRKLFNFLLLVHSQICGGGQMKRKSFDFLLLVHFLVKLIWIISGKAKKRVGGKSINQLIGLRIPTLKIVFYLIIYDDFVYQHYDVYCFH